MAKKNLPPGQVNKKTVEKLKDLMNDLSKKHSIKVGILQSEGSKKAKDADINMAELGAIHEFGATINVTDKMRRYLHSQGMHLKKETTQITIPAQSFLREPVLGSEGKKEILNKIKIIVPDNIKDYSENSQIKVMDDVCHIVAETALLQVQKAFDNNTIRPKTKPTSKKMRKYNPNNPTLVDQGELERSISYEIDGKKWGKND